VGDSIDVFRGTVCISMFGVRFEEPNVEDGFEEVSKVDFRFRRRRFEGCCGIEYTGGGVAYGE
jgi:hypothetical protein